MSTKTKRKSAKKDAKPIGDRLLTLHDAAKVLRQSTRTVREYVSRGEIEGRLRPNTAFHFGRKSSDIFS